VRARCSFASMGSQHKYIHVQNFFQKEVTKKSFPWYFGLTTSLVDVLLLRVAQTQHTPQGDTEVPVVTTLNCAFCTVAPITSYFLGKVSRDIKLDVFFKRRCNIPLYTARLFEIISGKRTWMCALAHRIKDDPMGDTLMISNRMGSQRPVHQGEILLPTFL